MSTEDLSALISIVGLLFSIWAWSRASSAKELAERIVGRSNEQEDTVRLRKLVESLHELAKVASRRRVGSPDAYSDGFSLAGDIERLQDVQNSLATASPLALANPLNSLIVDAAEDLDTAFQAITLESDQTDGWKHALLTLQLLIPELEKEERRLKNAALTQT